MKTRLLYVVVAVALLAAVLSGCKSEGSKRKEAAYAYIDNIIASTVSEPNVYVPLDTSWGKGDSPQTYIHDHVTLTKIKGFISRASVAEISDKVIYPWSAPLAIIDPQVYFADSYLVFRTEGEEKATCYNLIAADVASLKEYVETLRLATVG
ncbi:MAG: hypothetical protein LBN02_10285 [Oscillospiraceae bacterium]|jgi:hypothetical protein|nr:hypothetical protein [Oscillospiraceae bacterium]